MLLKLCESLSGRVNPQYLLITCLTQDQESVREGIDEILTEGVARFLFASLCCNEVDKISQKPDAENRNLIGMN